MALCKACEHTAARLCLLGAAVLLLDADTIVLTTANEGQLVLSRNGGQVMPHSN